LHIGNGQFLQGDCLELMREIPDGSVDMILCDLPYGTTQNKWDSVIPFEPLWEQYWRVCKPNAAVVLTAQQPFTAALIMSQVLNHRYNWVWVKSKITGVLNAKKMPVRKYEDICVFGRLPVTYNPQGLIKKGTLTKQGGNSENYGDRSTEAYIQEWTNYPRDVLEIPSEGKTVHPTQKPVALFEYLIRTYTNEGEHVLDNTAGSGTTAIAAENAGRRWTCIERDPTYYEAAIGRVFDHVAAQ
jgi:site-specific DNA-methyltransferase (adenine-specific)